MSIFSGLLLSLVMTNISASVSYAFLGEFPDICSGIPEERDAVTQQKTGVPFVFDEKTIEKVDHCSAAAVDISKTTLLKNYLTTWQFLVNWAVWTLPFLGIGYIIGKRYAHHRD